MGNVRRLTREELNSWFLCDKYLDSELDEMFFGRSAGCIFGILAAPIRTEEKLFVLLRSEFLDDEEKGRLADTFAAQEPSSKESASAAQGREFVMPPVEDFNLEQRLGVLEGATRRVVFASLWSLYAARRDGRGAEAAKTQLKQIIREVFYV